MKALHNKIAKTFFALEHVLTSPSLARQTLASLYNEKIISCGKIPCIKIEELIDTALEIRLINFVSEHGNVTSHELLCLCMMVQSFRPKQVLELGTFNGNTTLQIAANLVGEESITTLDLPVGNEPVNSNDKYDAGLISSYVREQPRYLKSPYESKVKQIYADSIEVDFATLTSSSPDFIFIDAGHSDECVRNDTDKSLKVLAPGGTIVWHDYTQDWPDVFNFLNELAESLPLKHIFGTNLVVYQDSNI